MTQENATQTGAFEPAHAGRSNALQEIAKRVHDQNSVDFNAFNEETGEIGAPVAQAPQQQEQQTPPTEEQQEQQEQQQAQVQTPADDGLELLIVDGQERKVKREQVLEAGKRTLQKEAAADRRLEEANEILRRAKAFEQGLFQRQPSSDAGSSQQPPSSDAANSGVTQQQATPDIGTLVEQKLWIHDANKAAQRFREEFKDITENPLLARLVAQLEDERLREAAEQGKPLGDPWEAYKAHGERIRKEFKLGQPTGQVQVPDDKAERKRQTVTVTGSSTTRPQPTQAKPPTTSERIEQMRIARMGRAIPIANAR